MDEELAAHLELAALSDEEFVDRAFRLLLRRPPGEDARANALASLREHRSSRAALLAELAASDEFARLRVLDDAVARAAAARTEDEHPHELAWPEGLDERPVEIAWTLGRYRGERRVLDVGYAFAEPVWLAALLAAGPQELVGVDLSEREVPGMRSVVADVRDLPFDAHAFDLVFCVSTLEHVGRDNTRYGLTTETDEAGPLAALRELRRVTAPRGRILVTVPVSERRDDWYLRQPAETWRSLFRDADLHVLDEEVYDGPDDHGVLCAELHPGRRRHELRRLLPRR